MSICFSNQIYTERMKVTETNNVHLKDVTWDSSSVSAPYTVANYELTHAKRLCRMPMNHETIALPDIET